MDFGLLLFVAAFIIYTEMSTRRKKRRKQRRKANLPPKPQNREPIKRKTPLSPRGKTEKQDDSFDFDGFRKKIHIAWGTEDDTKKDEKPHLEIDMSVKIGEDKPVPRKMPIQNAEQAPRMNAEETERFRRFQEAAKKKDAPLAAKTAEFFLVETGNTDGLGAKLPRGANAMRQWVRYDAVFGAPRSRAGWRPKGMRKC